MRGEAGVSSITLVAWETGWSLTAATTLQLLSTVTLYIYRVLRTNANFVARPIYVLRLISISYKAILYASDIINWWFIQVVVKLIIGVN